jgi:nucleoside-triphosphatase
MDKIFITAPPGEGKTTLIKEIISSFEVGFFAGFYTEEIRENKDRVGFMLYNTKGKPLGLLAHVKLNTPFRVGKYRVQLSTLDKVLEQEVLKKPSTNWVIIDEIGKMELLSKKFQEVIKILLEDKRRGLVCTFGQIINHPIIQRIVEDRSIIKLNLLRPNFSHLKNFIKEKINKNLSNK